MFGTLLESRARRHRRTGGAALSIAAHVAIIGVATAATVHGTASPRTAAKPDFIVFTATPAPKPIEHRKTAARPTSSRTTDFRPITLMITMPGTTPPNLPEIDLSVEVTHGDEIAIGAGAPGIRLGPRVGTLDLTEDRPPGELHGRELLMRIVSSAKPRYPEALRQNGIDGRVVVQFVVDTTGSVDPNSVRVLQSTHDLFTQAVRSALASFRFKPAEAGGRRTRALAEMPFEFRVTR